MDPVTRNILADAMLSHPTLRYVLSGGAAPVDFITPLAGSTNAAPPGKRTTQDDVAPGGSGQPDTRKPAARFAAVSSARRLQPTSYDAATISKGLLPFI